MENLYKPRPDPVIDSVMRRGTCKWFNSQKGFGFITPEDGSGDVFVHQSVIKADGFRSLAEGEPVEYYLDLAEANKTKAARVTGPNGANVQGAPQRRLQPVEQFFRFGYNQPQQAQYGTTYYQPNRPGLAPIAAANGISMNQQRTFTPQAWPGSSYTVGAFVGNYTLGSPSNFSQQSTPQNIYAQPSGQDFSNYQAYNQQTPFGFAIAPSPQNAQTGQQYQAGQQFAQFAYDTTSKEFFNSKASQMQMLPNSNQQSIEGDGSMAALTENN